MMSQMTSSVTEPSASGSAPSSAVAFASGDTDPNAALKMMCPLIGGLKCALPQPACASVTKDIPMLATGDLAAAEAACAAAGFPTDGAPDSASSAASLKSFAWIATAVAAFSYAL